MYEGGVLRPVEPLRLDEHQHVSVIILDDIADDGEELLFAPREEFETFADHAITLEDVRKELSAIPGSLNADFAAERNECWVPGYLFRSCITPALLIKLDTSTWYLSQDLCAKGSPPRR